MPSQIPLQAWPMGLEAQAVHLSLNPEEITRRSNLAFDRERDSLDDFDAAVVDLGNGKSFALQHYRNSPVPGTTLVLRPETSEGLREALKLLRIKQSEVTWVAPYLKEYLHAIFAKRRRHAAAKVVLAAAAAGAGAGASALAKRRKLRRKFSKSPLRAKLRA